MKNTIQNLSNFKNDIISSDFIVDYSHLKFLFLNRIKSPLLCEKHLRKLVISLAIP